MKATLSKTPPRLEAFEEKLAKRALARKCSGSLAGVQQVLSVTVTFTVFGFTV